ncbi:peptidase domain-containing ABC transporter, partial [Magnetococcales bacterium HHB-1]
ILASRSQETLLYFSGGVLLFLVGDMGFKLLRGQLFSFISVRLGNIVGNEVFRRILYLPPSHTESAPLGAQISRIRDFENVRTFFGETGIISLLDLPFLIIIFLALAWVAETIVLAPLGALFMFIALWFFLAPFIRKANAEAATSLSKRQEFVVEMLTHFRAIKYTGAVSLWGERFQTLSARAALDGYHAARWSTLAQTLSHMLVSGTGLVTMGWGALRILDGLMTPGALFASMMLVWRVLAPLRTGFVALAQIGKTRASIRQVDRLMQLDLEHKMEANMNFSRRLRGKVLFSQVSMRYSAQAYPVLMNVSFDLSPGEVLVVVGHDGAGKSTLLKLILGMYSPQGGRILLDDMNRRQIDPLMLRQSLGYVPQEAQFFHGTIAQNLRFANPLATDHDLKVATEKAHVLEEILKLEEGFSTRITDRNMNQFSTSLKKRLSLARVFLRPSHLILLDEPEDGLGLLEESAFIQHLSLRRGEDSMIIVTHRPSYFRIANKILWLDQGR